MIDNHRQKLKDFLQQELGLVLNRDDHPFYEVKGGFTFLGIFFGTDGKTISRAKERKIIRRLHQLTDPKIHPDPIKARLLLNRKIIGHQRFYGYIKPLEAFARFDELLVKRLRLMLSDYRKKGMMSSRNEMMAYCLELQFYLERPPSEHRKMVSKLCDLVFSRPASDEDPTTAAAKVAAAGRQHRTQARQSHYVKELAGESEVVVSSPGVFIGIRGSRLTLRQQRRIIFELPLSRLRSITITSSGVSLSSNLVRDCAGKNIPITFYNYSGRAYAAIRNPLFQSGDLTLKQVRMYVNGKGLVLSRKVIIAKCRSQMNVLKFYDRHRSHTDPVFHDRVVKALENMGRELGNLRQIKIEGRLAKVRNTVFTTEARISSGYWEMVKQLLPAEVGFHKRVKRGAQDVVNVMINYGYGILYQRVWQEVTNMLLNPEVGFLHAWNPGRPTLVYDLVEEYRQSFVDRPLFSLLTKGTAYRGLRLKPGSNLLSRETRDLVLKTVLGRLSSLINFRSHKVKAEQIIAMQIGDFSAVIAGRKKNYRPYIMGY